MSTFTIKAGPGTDIWRKPPHTDVFNAPTSSQDVSPPEKSRALSSFRSARVSFALPYREQYDQAGLVLSLRPKSSTSSSTIPDKWIKTGVEYYNGNPMLSTVACDAYADWSVSPLLAGAGASPTAGGKEWITAEIVREGDQYGPSLWVYQVVGDTRVPLREVAWVYGSCKEDEWVVSVEAMAARPEKGTSEDLVVDFKDFEVKWA